MSMQPRGQSAIERATSDLRTAFLMNPNIMAWLTNPTAALDPRSQQLVAQFLTNYGVSAEQVKQYGLQNYATGNQANRGQLAQGFLGSLGNAKQGAGDFFNALGTRLGGQPTPGGTTAPQGVGFNPVTGGAPSGPITRALTGLSAPGLTAESGGPAVLGAAATPGGGPPPGTTPPGQGPATPPPGGGLGQPPGDQGLAFGGPQPPDQAALADRFAGNQAYMQQFAQRLQQQQAAKEPTGGAAPAPGGTPVSGAQFDPTNTNPAWNTTIAMSALDQPDMLTMQALRSLGYDPLRLGTFGTALAQQLDPVLKAQAGLMGYLPGTGAGGTPDYNAVQGWAEQVGRNFVTPGMDANAIIRAQARGVAQDPTYRANLGQVTDDSQALDWIQNLALLSNQGAGGLAQSANAQRMRELRGLQDLMFRQGAKGTLMDWLNTQAPDSDYRRRLNILTGY